MTYSSQFVPWSKDINSGVSFAVLAAGDQALVSFDVLIHILAFLGWVLCFGPTEISSDFCES